MVQCEGDEKGIGPSLCLMPQLHGTHRAGKHSYHIINAAQPQTQAQGSNEEG